MRKETITFKYYELTQILTTRSKFFFLQDDYIVVCLVLTRLGGWAPNTFPSENLNLNKVQCRKKISIACKHLYFWNEVKSHSKAKSQHRGIFVLTGRLKICPQLN